MGKIRSRRENDFYPTPHSICEAMFQHISWPEKKVWEPCAGDGRMVQALEGRGYEVIAGDIVTGQDFFSYETALAPVLWTNPPFKHIRKFIPHAFNIGVLQMALVCNERIWASGIGLKQFTEHRPSRFVNLSWREDYLNKGRPDRSLAIAIWDSPCAEQCEYQVWEKPPG